MLYLINTYSGGDGSHRCPLAFGAAAPQCRIVTEMVGAGFSTRHYSSQLVQRSECERVKVRKERLFADETVPRAHVINVTDADDEGNVPASLVASCWWFARRHPQHVPISLLLTGKSFSSLEAVHKLGFAHRVEVLFISESTNPTDASFLSPLAIFTNVRKVCEFSPCGDVRWMLSCPQLAYVDVMGYNRPADWNAAEVFPKLLALTELILYEGGVGCATWLPKCTKLTKLTLNGCAWLEDCGMFSTMTELTFLKVAFGKLKDISGLAHCAKLTSLELGGTRELTDASVIGALTNLRNLNISHTDITDISWIRTCARLEELSLCDVNVQGGLDSLAELRHLRSITLLDVPQFSFEWVSPHACRLEEVVIHDFDVGGSLPTVSHLQHARLLRKLLLSKHGAGAWLSDCIMLEEVEMLCPASDLQTIHTGFALPRLRGLRLNLSGGNKGDGRENSVIPDVIRRQYPTSLEKLTVFGTNMLDSDATNLLDCVRHCTKLHSLSLRGVPLHGTSGAWLKGLASLQMLAIGDCKASTAALDSIGLLTELRELTLDAIHGWPGFAGEWLCGQLRTLTIRSCNAFVDGAAIRSGTPMNHLFSVFLSRVPLAELSFLERAPSLLLLIATNMSQLSNLTGVTCCPNLRSINIDRCPLLTSLDGMQHCDASLTECHISNCDSLVDLDALAALAALTNVRVSHLPNAIAIALTSAARLETVLIANCGRLTSLDMPPVAAKLRQFTIQKCPRVVALPSFDHCGALEMVSLLNNAHIHALPSVRGCTSLSFVRLCHLSSLSDLSALLDSTNSLRRVHMSACKSVANLDVLAQLPRLTTLNLSMMALADLSWIGQCTSLTCLGLTSCTGTTDYSTIATLTQLKSLSISSCPLEDISWASQMASPPIEEFEVRECAKLKVSDAASLPRFVQLR